MSSFQEYVARYEGSGLPLPFVHTTDSKGLNGAITSNVLMTRLCEVFNRDLIYLFYGRPAYRPRGDMARSNKTKYELTCFGFKCATLIESICGVYPFDSGAAYKGLYSPHINKEQAGNYELLANIDAARQTVEAFFETNLNYYVGIMRPQPGNDVPEEAKRFYELVNDYENPDLDDRKKAIEIQLDQHVSIRDSIQLIIVPLAFLDREDIIETIFATWDIIPDNYFTVDSLRPKDAVGAIQHVLFKKLKEGGILR
jgi:hypothetical protein